LRMLSIHWASYIVESRYFSFQQNMALLIQHRSGTKVQPLPTTRNQPTRPGDKRWLCWNEDCLQTDVSISIIESATFGAYLHITGEQSRFVPDLRVAILAAVFREQQYLCERCSS
jgi:hypothetical protein